MNKLDDGALETVRTAITADDPMVRAVAARIAAIQSHAPFATLLATAFTNEQDAAAAREQARALLYIRGPLASNQIESRIDSSASIARVYAEWLAMAQPEQLPDLLPRLAKTLGDDRGTLRVHVGTALDTRPQTAERLLRAWLNVSSGLSWRQLLDTVHAQSRPGQDAVLINALTTAASDIREATVWNLVFRLSTNRPIPTVLLDTVVAEIPEDAAVATALTWEQFGREVIARRHRGQQTPDRSAFLTAEASKHTGDAIAVARLPQTLETERKAIKVALGERYPRDLSRAPELLRAQGSEPIRTIPSPWMGFMKHLLDSVKCSSGRTAEFGVVAVAFRPNGTVGHVQVGPTGIPAACRPALTALARLTLRDPAYPPPPDKGELLILPLSRDAIDCASAIDGSDAGGLPNPWRSDAERGAITPPRKVRDLKPDYPRDALQSRVQGTVVTESIISRTGCIAQVKVVRSVSPSVDFAAVRAVTQWAFTPTMLDGEPKPVILTVAVNFTVQ